MWASSNTEVLQAETHNCAVINTLLLRGKNALIIGHKAFWGFFLLFCARLANDSNELAFCFCLTFKCDGTFLKVTTVYVRKSLYWDLSCS